MSIRKGVARMGQRQTAKSAAPVSMLTLETTMLTVFGKGEKGDFDRIMTGSTGAAVTLTVLIMAVYMIVKSTKELKAKNNTLT